MKKQKLEILDRPKRVDIETYEVFVFGVFLGAVGLYGYMQFFGG
ncbi:MAG: hypothetical protein ACR2PP_04415 [Psychrobacter sp.]|jgi:hypothetical protein